MDKHPTDLTQPPDLKHERRTGPFRTQHPVYRDLLPVCNSTCPAGENIQLWLSHVAAGRFREAWNVILRDNPLPAVLGRVCYHSCESSCNRGDIDDPVSIHAVERFLGDLALKEKWTPEVPTVKSGKKVLVVGAGPSGLSAAHHLALQGQEVVIHEAGPLAGGMMHFGIPAYRLPRNVLDGEVERIRSMGVQIVLNRRVVDLAATIREGGFDAVFVAVGAHLGKKTEIPARDAGRILDAVGFLKDVEMGGRPKLGRRVAIYGGGNSAMDAARVAIRLGSEPLIIYRRDREHMPAHEFEADEALEEGVKIHWLRTIKSIDATTFTVEVMEIDENGRPRPTGEVETLEADDLILALGQDTDTQFLCGLPGIEFNSEGCVIVDSRMMTGCPGVFAGGDMVPSERTVTIAVGHGKKAALNIDAYLDGRTYDKKQTPPVASLEKLHLWFYTESGQRVQAKIDMTRRTRGFDEVVHGLSAEAALFEAKRCFSCGNCFECDGCYGACPEDAIIKLGLGNRYQFDYNKCTGCAICFEQCPPHAISMIPEQEFTEGAVAP